MMDNNQNNYNNQNNGQNSWGDPNAQNGGWQYTNGQFYGQQTPLINNTAHANKEASTAQTLGIVGLVVSLICCALAGIILGILAISRAGKAKNLLGYESPEAKTGRICGIVAIILGTLSMIGSAIINFLFQGVLEEVMRGMQAFFTLLI